MIIIKHIRDNFYAIVIDLGNAIGATIIEIGLNGKIDYTQFDRHQDYADAMEMVSRGYSLDWEDELLMQIQRQCVILTTMSGGRDYAIDGLPFSQYVFDALNLVYPGGVDYLLETSSYVVAW